MRGFDEVEFLAEEARRTAEREAYRLDREHDGFLTFEQTRRVHRGRFRTLAERVKRTGAPFGAHTIVHRADGDLLLVRHEGVDKWVLPGGGVHDGETFLEAAARELAEEAGVDVAYEGLAIRTRVDIACERYRTWGTVPVFAAEAVTEEPEVCDPDGEISDARWFSTLPPDTRDRSYLRAWREERGYGNP